MNFCDETYYQNFAGALLKEVLADEILSLQVVGEENQFTRFNGGKVRQTGFIKNGVVEATLIAGHDGKYNKSSFLLQISGDSNHDIATAKSQLKHLRRDLENLPLDPYIKCPVGENQSHQVKKGSIPSPEKLTEHVLKEGSKLDLVGLLSAGQCVRGLFDSVGNRHWFSVNSFNVDYSIYGEKERAVKSFYSASTWSDEDWEKNIKSAQKKIDILSRTPKRLERGDYRVYLEPEGLVEVVHLLNWGAFSESQIRQGKSSIRRMRTEGVEFSPKFNFEENFSSGLTPRFNDQGELAKEKLTFVENGKLKDTLISAQSEMEYGLKANGASHGEMIRSARIKAGKLKEDTILSELGTGLYLSNLHYLNWSDVFRGRITGMTRYACFWVENGEILAPIENMRFDINIFEFFGDDLLELGDKESLIPECGTYHFRALGGSKVPGILVKRMPFTI